MMPASATRRERFRRFARRAGGVLTCLAAVLLMAVDEAPRELGKAGEAAKPMAAAAKAGRLIRVPLPIIGNADTQVIAAARKAMADLPVGDQRSVLVLEFSSSDNQTGQGSDFERALKLARFLSSGEASAVETVAYIPKALKGHAVLAAMACESIIMGPEAVFGDAGLDEPAEQMTDPTVRSGYREIANRRRTVPAQVAVAMLDKNVELLKVETEVSPEFVLESDLDELKEKHSIHSQTVLSPPGEFALFTGSDARREGFAKYLAADRNALARALSVPAKDLEDDPSLWGQWRPVAVALEGPITPTSVSRVQRTIETQIRDRGINFVVLRIDSSGGSLADSLTLAHFLAELDPAQVRVVAYVPRRALADAGLVAMSADQLVMNHDAVLGGGGETTFSPDDLELTRQTLRESLSPLKQRSWSLMAALVDPQVRVFAYTDKENGSIAYFSPDEREDQADPNVWVQGQEITRTEEPLQVTGDRAHELGMARFVVQDFAGFKQQYGLEGDVTLAEPGWADYLIEALAAPAVAWLLLLVGGAALYAEIQSPGIGVGAFTAGVCFLLYFWSKHLDGTAGWLEVLLFTAGVCCVLLELFVLPGTGIFGLGGGMLIIVSLILASQTFVFPHNEYQMTQLRDSLLGLLGVGVGIGVLAMLMQRYLPHTPLFSNMMLEPPSGAELEDLSHRESLVDFEHLLGVEGVAATQLTPSGKARLDGKLIDVIAEGDLIARGQPVAVTEVHGNRVVVQSVPDRA